MDHIGVRGAIAALELLPVKDPVQVFKALGRLEVIGEEKVVCKRDQNPDKIGTEEERLAGQLVNPVARRCNLCLLIINCLDNYPPGRLCQGPWSDQPRQGSQKMTQWVRCQQDPRGEAQHAF